jgi:hypothetical protein
MLLALPMPWLTACGVALQTGRPAPGTHAAFEVSEPRAASCPRSPGGEGQVHRQELPGAVADPDSLRVLAQLPPRARRTALAAGLEPLISRILLARERSGPEPSLELLGMRQQLDAQLALLQPQLLAMEFETECLLVLLREVLAAHDDARDRWSMQLAVASLVVGAAAGIGAGLWDLAGEESNGPAVVALAGGVASAALGAAALAPPRRPLVFVHEHNLLGPIERGEDPLRLYPTFVFRLLTLPTGTSEPPERDRLITAWHTLLAEHASGDELRTAEAIVWGDGGVYDADLLELHVEMLEQLETSLDAYARDIDRLSVSLAELLDGSLLDAAQARAASAR